MPKNFVITKQSPLLQDDVDCNYCHTDLRLDDLATECERCGSPHHADCWEANSNQCATFGCASQINRQAANRPVAPARPRTERPNLPRAVARNFPIRLNARRVFGGVAFIALMLYTLIFEAGVDTGQVLFVPRQRLHRFLSHRHPQVH